MIDPGRTNFLINRRSVSLFFCSLGSVKATTKLCLEFLSMPPKSQIWLRVLAWLYLHLTINVSSISTYISWPPIGSWFCSQLWQTSEQKNLQSTVEQLEMSRFSMTVLWSHKLLKKWLTKRIIFQHSMRVWSIKVPFASLTLKPQYFLFFFYMARHKNLCIGISIYLPYRNMVAYT